MRSLANAAAFQLVWFAAVIGAGSGRAWPGVLAVLLFALLHLSMNPRHWSADLSLVLSAAVAGFALDSVFVATGLLRYAAPWPSGALAPAWIVALWINLALTLNHSLRWLQPRPWLAAALGAGAAVCSYLAAARGWQAVEFAAPETRTLAIVAACWALLLPMLCTVARRMAPRMADAAGVARTHGEHRPSMRPAATTDPGRTP